jgi:hypothetical protein
MTSPETRSRMRTLNRHLATEYARDQVRRALFEVVNDGLAIGPRDVASYADRDWMRGALALPIQEATQVALDLLAWRIDGLLVRAPDDWRQTFDRHYAEELALD